MPDPDSVVRAVSDFLRRRDLPAESHIDVACSGGADSLALAGAVLGVLGPQRVRGVTVDHGLQEGSAGQAERTQQLLREIGYRQLMVRTVAVGTDGGMEAAARRARYRALTPEAGTAAVLLGHTLDDQAETVLLGLARGSGPRSIAGMRPWRPPWGRPLLGIRRSDTESYCRRSSLQYFSDPQNADPRFTRVRLRREVLPLLEEVLGGGVAPALARTSDLLAEDLQALDLLAAQALAECAERIAGSSVLGLDLDVLAGHPPALRKRVLRAWASAAGAHPLTAEHLRRLDELSCGVRRSGAIRLPGAIDAVRQHSRLLSVPVGGS